jgi:hypothetical protein
VVDSEDERLDVSENPDDEGFRVAHPPPEPESHQPLRRTVTVTLGN